MAILSFAPRCNGIARFDCKLKVSSPNFFSQRVGNDVIREHISFLNMVIAIAVDISTL